MFVGQVKAWGDRVCRFLSENVDDDWEAVKYSGKSEEIEIPICPKNQNKTTGDHHESTTKTQKRACGRFDTDFKLCTFTNSASETKDHLQHHRQYNFCV